MDPIEPGNEWAATLARMNASDDMNPEPASSCDKSHSGAFQPIRTRAVPIATVTVHFDGTGKQPPYFNFQWHVTSEDGMFPANGTGMLPMPSVNSEKI
jgi:hypothetical protein